MNEIDGESREMGGPPTVPVLNAMLLLRPPFANKGLILPAADSAA